MHPIDACSRKKVKKSKKRKKIARACAMLGTTVSHTYKLRNSFLRILYLMGPTKILILQDKKFGKKNPFYLETIFPKTIPKTIIGDALTVPTT